MLSTRQLCRSNNQPASYAALTQFAPEPFDSRVSVWPSSGDAKLTDLLATLADCPKARSVSVHDRCKAVYSDLNLDERQPPDCRRSRRAPFTRDGRPAHFAPSVLVLSEHRVGVFEVAPPFHSHANELRHETVRRSRSDRLWQSGCRKTPLTAVANAMRAKPKDHHAGTLAHEAPPPGPLTRRLDNFLVRRRWDRRLCLVYRGVCALCACGRLFA
jgi:hypothetical protein